MKQWIKSLTLGLAVSCSNAALAEDRWFPFPVDSWDQPFVQNSSRTNKDYVPLSTATKRWKICVSFPHLKDAYWEAVNYGIYQEVRRLNLKMSLFEAGGYDLLDVQRQQITECAKTNPDGFIISAVTATGLNDLVEELAARNIPVIDLINGLDSPHIAARSAVTYYDNGFLSAQWILKQHAGSDNPVRVAWFPGPKKAAWAQAGHQGFLDGIKDSQIEIVTTGYGDTGKKVQSKLVRQALKDHDNIDYIVGTTVTAISAVRELRRQRLSGKIGIVAYYFGPAVHREMKAGNILAAPSDQQAIEGRIAVDQLIRILEGQPVLRHVGPKLAVLDRATLKDFDLTTSIAPRGFRPVFRVD